MSMMGHYKVTYGERVSYPCGYGFYCPAAPHPKGWKLRVYREEDWLLSAFFGPRLVPVGWAQDDNHARKLMEKDIKECVRALRYPKRFLAWDRD